MVVVSLDQYLNSKIQVNRINSNEIDLEETNPNFDLFTIHLENRNNSNHRYLDPFATILYALHEESNVQIGSRVVRLKAGNILVINKNCGYEVQMSKSDNVLVKFKMNPRFDFKDFFSELVQDGEKEKKMITNIEQRFKRDKFLWLKNTTVARPTEILQSIINTYLNQELFSKTILQAELKLMLTLAIRNQQIAAITRAENSEFDTVALDKYINNHFSDITLSKAAEYFGFNPNYFSNLVKQKTGKSFVDHVDDRRMQEAKILLAKPNLSLKEIIERVGYSSKSFFYKKFNQYYGETPAVMRERLFSQAHINLK